MTPKPPELPRFVRHLRRLLPVTCLVLASAVSGFGREPLAALPVRSKIGVWVWQDESFGTAQARRELLKFCAAHGINHLEVHLKLVRDAQGWWPRQAEPLRSLLAEAAQAGVTVAGLRGDRLMFSAANRQRLLSEVEGIARFHKSLPPGAGFCGLKFDVEPTSTPQWRTGGAARAELMRDYLEALDQLHTCFAAHAPEWKLMVDVPFWLDRPELRIAHAGVTNLYSEHVQARADEVTLMSYRRDPAEVARIVETERVCAAALGKGIVAALEVTPDADAPHITFLGRPVSEFEAAFAGIRERLGGKPGVRGFMIHSYEGWRAYLAAPQPPATSMNLKGKEPGVKPARSPK